MEEAMARLARTIIPGLPDHVTQRGNGRAQTFFGVLDYRLYLDLLAALRRSETIGRPLGSAAFLEDLERFTVRRLRAAKRGSKPRKKPPNSTGTTINSALSP